MDLLHPEPIPVDRALLTLDRHAPEHVEDKTTDRVPVSFGERHLCGVVQFVDENPPVDLEGAIQLLIDQ